MVVSYADCKGYGSQTTVYRYKTFFNGVPVIVVSKILGHSKTSITLDTYGHMILEMQEDVARMMDDLVIPIKVDVQEFKKLEILKKGKSLNSLEPTSPELLQTAPNCTELHQKRSTHLVGGHSLL